MLRTLTDDERNARAHALADARVREAEERKIAEEDARRRQSREGMEQAEREAAETRKREEEDRHRREEEAKRKAEQEAKKRFGEDTAAASRWRAARRRRDPALEAEDEEAAAHPQPTGCAGGADASRYRSEADACGRAEAAYPPDRRQRFQAPTKCASVRSLHSAAAPSA